MLNMST